MAASNTMSTMGPVGSGLVPNYWADFLRGNLFPHQYFRQLGEKITIPNGNGNTVKIPRFRSAVKNALNPGQTTLSAAAGGEVMSAVGHMTEGTAPTASAVLQNDVISGHITAWVGFYSYSDRAAFASMADLVQAAVRELGRQQAYRIDTYTRTKISANAFIRTAGGAIGTAKTASTAGLQGKYIAKIGPTFEAYNVPAWDDGTYVALINPLAKYSIFADTSANGYIPVSRYTDPSKAYKGEIGEFFGVRFLTTTMVNKVIGAAGTSATVGLSPGVTGAYAWVFAPKAFYAVEHQAGGFFVYHAPPTAQLSDPAAQQGTVAIKAWYGVIPELASEKRLMLFSHGLQLLS